MNLNHFCDPDLKHYDDSHKFCCGKTIIDFGRDTELIVKCDCECHKK